MIHLLLSLLLVLLLYRVIVNASRRVAFDGVFGERVLFAVSFCPCFWNTQRIEKGLNAGQCLHTPSTARHPHGQSVSLRSSEVEMIRRLQREARVRSSWPSEKVGYLDKDTR